MALEEIEERFVTSNIEDDEIEELVIEEVEDLVEEKSRRSILEEIEDMDEEFQDVVVQALDQEIMSVYSDQIGRDAEFEEMFSETIESLQQDYSRDEILQMAHNHSQEFEEKVREELE